MILQFISYDTVTVLLFHRREPGMVGQKQISVFSHVETTRGMGQVNIPVGKSSSFITPMKNIKNNNDNKV